MKSFRYLIPVTLIASSLAAYAQDAEKKFEVYGFLQTDYVQDFKRVNPAWDDTMRPSKIPTQEGQFGSDGQAIISVRQSRFGVKGDLPVNGKNLSTKFEIDMFGVGVDEGQTTIRLRHAYGQWGKWLGGQTNSLFMDGDTFPNIIDYWGPNGMVFLRTPQLRYNIMSGNDELAVALEKPGNDIDPGQIRTIDPSIGNNIRNDEKFPDVTAAYKMTRDWGYFRAGGILRSIGYETLGQPGNNPKDRETGMGLDLTSNIKAQGKDKWILGLVYGRGIASYMNDGGTDMAPAGSAGNPRAKVVPLLGLNIYYDHFWNEKYSTSIGYARTQVENTSLQTADAFKKAEYASVNLLSTPVKNILYGAELQYGNRQDKNGAFGDDIRTQISFKYNFSSLDF
jgi:hypothetical protein